MTSSSTPYAQGGLHRVDTMMSSVEPFMIGATMEAVSLNSRWRCWSGVNTVLHSRGEEDHQEKRSEKPDEGCD